MKKLTTIGEVRENLQALETSVIQWLDSNPSESVQKSLNEAQEKIKKCKEYCSLPLKIAVVGDWKSGKSSLINAIFDASDILPYFSKAVPTNCVEIKVSLKKNEEAPSVKNCTISFLNQTETWEILSGHLSDLSKHGLAVPKGINSIEKLASLEDSLLTLFSSAKTTVAKNAVFSTLEYIIALKHSKTLVLRETGHEDDLPKNLLKGAMYFSERLGVDSGAQDYHSVLTQIHENAGSYNINDTFNEDNLKVVFPLIKKITLEVEAWCTPFGIETPDACSSISLWCLPDLGEISGAKERMLSLPVIKDSHSVLAVLDAASANNNETMGLVSIIQQAGKQSVDQIGRAHV